MRVFPDRSAEASDPPREREPSFVHLLLVWLLVGRSFFRLGRDGIAAIQAPLPVSPTGASLLFGTLVIVSLWITGFRPSIRASAGYFGTELLLSMLLIRGPGILLFGPTLGAVQEMGLRTLSIVSAGTLVFSDAGDRFRTWLRQQGGRIIKTPPREKSNEV